MFIDMANSFCSDPFITFSEVGHDQAKTEKLEFSKFDHVNWTEDMPIRGVD